MIWVTREHDIGIDDWVNPFGLILTAFSSPCSDLPLAIDKSRLQN